MTTVAPHTASDTLRVTITIERSMPLGVCRSSDGETGYLSEGEWLQKMYPTWLPETSHTSHKAVLYDDDSPYGRVSPLFELSCSGKECASCGFGMWWTQPEPTHRGSGKHLL